MVYKRLIGCIVVRGGLAVQSFEFRRYLPIGRPEIVAKHLDNWEVDEIVLLDMDATAQGRGPDLHLVERVASSIFTPLSIGGGIRTAAHVHQLLRSGADKVVINTAVREDPNLLTLLAEQFGQQCLIASVDALETPSGYVVRGGANERGAEPPMVRDFVQRLESCGAGEILLNSVSRDGMRRGYDMGLLTIIGGCTTVPLIALGGAGHPRHIVEVLKSPQVSAAAVGNMLNHSEHSALAIKSFLLNAGVNVRLGTYGERVKGPFDSDSRLAKKSEDFLDDTDFIEPESDVI